MNRTINVSSSIWNKLPENKRTMSIETVRYIFNTMKLTPLQKRELLDLLAELKKNDRRKNETVS